METFRIYEWKINISSQEEYDALDGDQKDTVAKYLGTDHSCVKYVSEETVQTKWGSYTTIFMRYKEMFTYKVRVLNMDSRIKMMLERARAKSYEYDKD